MKIMFARRNHITAMNIYKKMKQGKEATGGIATLPGNGYDC